MGRIEKVLNLFYGLSNHDRDVLIQFLECMPAGSIDDFLLVYRERDLYGPEQSGPEGHSSQSPRAS